MALRTNSKQAKANLWQYIRAYMLDEMTEAQEWAEKTGEGFPYNMEDNKSIAQFMLDTFESEYLHEYNKNMIRTGRASRYSLFESWASGLALGGLFCYYYNREAVQDVAQILEETEAEAQRFSEEQAESFLTRYIYNTITAEAEKA